jgi:hypothetical protein
MAKVLPPLPDDLPNEIIDEMKQELAQHLRDTIRIEVEVEYSPDYTSYDVNVSAVIEYKGVTNTVATLNRQLDAPLPF